MMFTVMLSILRRGSSRLPSREAFVSRRRCTIRSRTNSNSHSQVSGGRSGRNGGKSSFDVHRLAVLPLSNISPNPQDSYFAYGMTEELITVLSQLQGLRVIARTSSEHYTGKEKRVSQIAQELQVGSVMEGSVRMAGQSIRVTVQLIDGANEEHIWSENYDRKLDDIFAIQTEIANQVAQSLKLKLLREEKDRLNTRATE